MNETNSQIKQRGTFSIEFAIVAVSLSMVIVLTGDVVMKQAIKGKLDRLSYSSVSLIKERTQLFDENERITAQQTSQLFQVVERSLASTMQSFNVDRLGMRIEQQRYDGDGNPIEPRVGSELFSLGSYDCAPTTALRQQTSLSPMSQLRRKLSLYQVTLCYRSDNWYGALVGETYQRVSSTSISVGR